MMDVFKIGLSVREGSLVRRREFYEIDAFRRRAGKNLAQTHKISLSMMDINCNDVVLEVGCGGGALSSEINKEAGLTVGLDLSHTQIRHARSYFGKSIHFIIGDAEKLPFRDHAFTKCFAIEILEHVQNPSQMVKEIHCVLKDCGELLIVVPNDRNWLLYRFFGGYFHEALYDYGHLHDFSSLDRLCPLIKGFKICAFKEYKAPTIPMMYQINLLIQSSRKIFKASQKKPQSQYKSEGIFQKRFFSIMPKLTLHLVIKLKKQ